MLIYKCVVRIVFDYLMLKICNLLSVMWDGYMLIWLKKEESFICVMNFEFFWIWCRYGLWEILYMILFYWFLEWELYNIGKR